MDDLANLLTSTRSNITVGSSDKELTWKLIKSSSDKNFQTVFSRMIDITSFEFNDIYQGRRIVISFGRYFRILIKYNKHLGFHLSRNQYFESSNVLLYSKTIDHRVKRRIDSAIDRVYESGLQDFWWELLIKPKLDINESRDDDNQDITVQSIRGIFILLFTINLSLICVIICEFIINNMKH